MLEVAGQDLEFELVIFIGAGGSWCWWLAGAKTANIFLAGLKRNSSWFR